MVNKILFTDFVANNSGVRSLMDMFMRNWFTFNALCIAFKDGIFKRRL